ncbi:MAG TPA: bifunctional riboflavin kinase/FAD synthetase [Anaerolineaceae bacterium]|nr:bifunctional riboflavin kinase/FAD synthetase [Anaerolineaceae bacterium]
MTEFLNSFPQSAKAPIWLTIGNFDGLHLGHQALIQKLCTKAAETNARAVAITFYPHPRVFFGTEKLPYNLMTRNEKNSMFAQLGLDMVVTLPFTQSLASMAAEDFLSELISHFSLQGIVMGPDFSLGKDREGTIPAIQAFMRRFGIQVLRESPVLLEGQVVSSESIRTVLGNGRPELAAAMLGRPYSMSGKVQTGKKLGRRIGLPTANLLIEPEKFVPKYGVYASKTWLDGKSYASVSSIGVRPTVEENATPNVETLILDFDHDIYDKEIKVDFIQFIRPEIRFENIGDLIQRIEQDKEEARSILKHGS